MTLKQSREQNPCEMHMTVSLPGEVFCTSDHFKQLAAGCAQNAATADEISRRPYFPARYPADESLVGFLFVQYSCLLAEIGRNARMNSCGQLQVLTDSRAAHSLAPPLHRHATIICECTNRLSGVSGVAGGSKATLGPARRALGAHANEDVEQHPLVMSRGVAAAAGCS